MADDGALVAGTRCPYCEHVNQEGSKFCNACGGALHLTPCPGCGAVNDVTAATCHQCRRELPWSRKERTVADEAAAAAPPPGRASRLMQHARAIAGTAAVAAVSAFIGYNYGQRPRVDATPPAKSEVGQNTPPAEIPANAKSAEPRKARANTASTRRPVSKTPPRAAQKGGNAAPAPAAPREQVTGAATADGPEE